MVSEIGNGTILTKSPDRHLHLRLAIRTKRQPCFALRYNGRKRVHDADDAIGQITAKRLVRHPEAVQPPAGWGSDANARVPACLARREGELP